jgi:hypothetical protein
LLKEPLRHLTSDQSSVLSEEHKGDLQQAEVFITTDNSFSTDFVSSKPPQVSLTFLTDLVR